MWPELGASANQLSYAVGVLLCGTVALRLCVLSGLPTLRVLGALCAAAVLIFVGSKLLYVTEHALIPLRRPYATDPGSAALLGEGARLPGGVLLFALGLPLLGRLFVLPWRTLGDCVMPGLGAAIVSVRTGCLLRGCCFGERCDLPWAIRLPIGTPAYDWYIFSGAIAWPAPQTVPLHPLQLYFIAAGTLLFALGLYWWKRRARPGEVLVKGMAFYAGTTFLIERFRAYSLPLNDWLTGVTAVSALVVWVMVLRPGIARETETP